MRPLRVGVLRADSVLPDLAVRHGEYPEMFRSVLLKADPGVEVVSFDVERGELPPRGGYCDGYVITGSRRSVYEAEPWIERLGAWVQEAVAEGTSLVGVCFGHQLVAHALGGKTEKAPRGWTIGVQTYDLTEPLPGTGAGCSLKLIHSHQDQVTALPPGAERLGGNAACPIALYRIGERVLCVQGHPEFSPEYARDLYAKRREVFGERLYADALASLAVPSDRVAFAHAMLAVIRGG